jgi:hypothetical protein
MIMMTEQIVVSKTSKIYTLVDEMLGVINEAVEKQLPLHEVEKDVLSRALAMGREALQMLLDKLGHGDVGEECELPDGRTLKRSEEPKTREYQSVFGCFTLERYVYAQRPGQKAELIPLDARLALPQSKFSYLLQDFDQHLAMEESFAQTASTIERILGVRQHVDNLERTNHKMAEHVDQFYAQQQQRPALEEEGEILVETADGKGVPIRRAADAPRIDDHQRKTGPKPDRKKMATVASVYSVDRYPRTAEQIVDALFRQPHEKRPDSTERPRPCHKRVRASLSYTDTDGEQISGRAVMFGWMADEVKARNGGGDKPVVCIMDGEQSLWEEIDVFQDEKQRVEILDLLHVTPRLWQAAHLFCNNQQEAAGFVRQRLRKVLRGEIGGVIRGLRRLATSRLSGKSRGTVQTICQYFENNRHRTRYDHYLAEGYPIASGVIEGACRHVVKDRMERSGMNWCIPGAQAMLQLRSVHASGHWDEFVDSYSASQTQRLHPHRALLDNLPWHTAA